MKKSKGDEMKRKSENEKEIIIKKISSNVIKHKNLIAILENIKIDLECNDNDYLEKDLKALGNRCESVFYQTS